MDMVTERRKRLLKLFITGTFGYKGFREMEPLLKANGRVELTLLLPGGGPGSQVKSIVNFDFETELGDTVVRSLLAQVSGVEDVSIREVAHV